MDIVGRKKWFLSVTAIYILVAVFLTAVFGLKSGIEFSSGSILTLNFEKEMGQSELKQALARAGYPGAIVQLTSKGDFIVRTPELTSEAKTALESALGGELGEVKEVEFKSVSPMIAAETTRNTIIAVVVASFGIMLYLAWAFRQMPSPFLYGVGAVIALAHDSLVSIGVFSLLGRFYNWEINLMFIMGILAVIGYSVNNTVVVFDRIRENATRGLSRDFDTLVNYSISETLGRCINTSLTTLIMILALLLFIGSTIRNFAVVLMVGLIAGTFSSSFLAPLLLVLWQKKKEADTD
ncbi:MAG: protein translocase subunit SecF [Chloroflexota bacterium]